MALKDLPKGHWMHGAMEKEKARLAKKKKPIQPAAKPAMAPAAMAAPVAGPAWSGGGAC